MSQLEVPPSWYRAPGGESDGLDRLLLGDSAAMVGIRRLIRRIGPSELPVFIVGPTGSGKELVARALHRASARSGALVAINVSAVPRSTFETALFGHVKGAFTGANADHPGHLAEANGGTLFLDEIGELSLDLQPKLLRAVELGTYRPVGASRDRQSSFRLIAATNQRIACLLESGRMRADLVYRLAVLVIELPALRDRREDIPMLARHFAAGSAKRAVQVQEAAMECLCRHDWPGNVRELKGTIEAALLLAGDDGMTASSVEALLRRHGAPSANARETQVARLAALMRRHEGNVEAAAREERQHPATIYRQLRRSGMAPPSKWRFPQDVDGEGDTGRTHG